MKVKQRKILFITESKVKNFFEIEISELAEIHSAKLVHKKCMPVFCQIDSMDPDKINLLCFKTKTNEVFNLVISRNDHMQVRQMKKKIVHVEFLHEIGNKKDFSTFYSMNAYRFPWNSRIELFKWGTGIKLKQLNLNTSSLEMKEEALAA
jgi:hypothetical protein